jgi:hypothetical protein
MLIPIRADVTENYIVKITQMIHQRSSFNELSELNVVLSFFYRNVLGRWYVSIAPYVGLHVKFYQCKRRGLI